MVSASGEGREGKRRVGHQWGWKGSPLDKRRRAQPIRGGEVEGKGRGRRGEWRWQRGGRGGEEERRGRGGERRGERRGV